MARPKKNGLDYFPLDVDFFEDEKMLAISGEFAVKGEVIVLRLLCEIYRNGYFVEYSGLLKNKLARLGGLSGGLVDEVVGRLVEYGFFDGSLFRERNILTSKAIQSRYAKATPRRKNCHTSPFWLLDGVYVDINPPLPGVNDDIYPQSKGNERKEKERIPPYPPRGYEDFSGLPESLQAALGTYWAVRAESGKPIKAIQQGAMVAKLLSATGNDFAKAVEWVELATVHNWGGFYPPSGPTPTKKGKQHANKDNNPDQPVSGEDERLRKASQLTDEERAEYEQLYGEPPPC